MAKLTVKSVVRGIAEIFTDYANREQPLKEILDQAKAANLDFKQIATGLMREMETDFGWQIDDARIIAEALRPYGIKKFSFKITIDTDDEEFF